MQMQMIPIGKDIKLGDVPKLFVTLNDAVRDEVAEGVRFMSEYPPSPAGSTYRRTGTLRRSWSFEVKSGGGRIEGSVGSNSNVAPYNMTVQGDEQGSVFINIGWRDTKTLGKIMEKDFPGRCQSLVDKYFS